MKIDKAYIEITNRCNLNCRDCYNSSGLNRSTIEISAETLQNIFSTLNKKYGVTTFHISGGEPTLHSEWHKILDLMEKETHLSFFIVTNGTIRDDRFYDLLERDKRFIVQFSIDGVDEATHSMVRGSSNFKKTIENLSSFKPKNRPIIKMVVTRYNHHQVEEYFKLACRLNAIPAFSFAEKMGNADKNWDEMYLNANEKVSVLEEISEMTKKYNVETIPPYAAFNCPITLGNPLILCIKPTGAIQPCQNLYDERFTIGSVYDFDFNAMAFKLKSLRNEIDKRKSIDYNCERCINNHWCDRGCAASAFMLHGDILANDGACAFKTLQTVKISLLNTLKEQKERQNV